MFKCKVVGFGVLAAQHCSSVCVQVKQDVKWALETVIKCQFFNMKEPFPPASSLC